MGIVLGLVAAITYGASDFTGGLVSRRAQTLTVVVVSQITGLLLLLVLLAPLWGDGPSAQGALWGALAGVAGGGGVVLLYRGLAIGRMSVVAPVTGLLAASVPVVLSMLAGQVPSALASVGVVVALISIVLVSAAPDDAPAAGTGAGEGPGGAPGAVASARRLRLRPGLAEALGAGAGFGLFFLLLTAADGGGAIWPLLWSKAASVLLLTGLAVGRRVALRPPPGTAWLMVVAGVLDMTANAAFLLASRASVLSIAAVLTSLYPAGTILLARLVLHERLHVRQRAGLVFAALGVVFITLG